MVLEQFLPYPGYIKSSQHKLFHNINTYTKLAFFLKIDPNKTVYRYCVIPILRKYKIWYDFAI